MNRAPQWMDVVSVLADVGACLGGFAAAGLAYWAVQLQYRARGALAVAHPKVAGFRWPMKGPVECRLALVFSNSALCLGVVEDLRVLMNGPSGTTEMAYEKLLEDVAQPDAALPLYMGAEKVIGAEHSQPGIERLASAILVGGYGGEHRVCAFVEPGGKSRLDARDGQHRLTLQLRFTTEDEWMTIAVVDVELSRQRIPQGDGYFSPVIVPAVSVRTA